MNAHDRATLDTSLSGTRLVGRMTLVLGLFELIVFALFVNKVRQTSDWALQYNRQTQAEVGQWTLSMIVIAVMCRRASACASSWKPIWLNTNVEPRLVAVAVRSGQDQTEREGPFCIESKGQQNFLIGAVGLRAGRSIAELEQRGFAFTVDRCE